MKRENRKKERKKERNIQQINVDYQKERKSIC